LWLYREVRRTGLLSIPPVRRAYELVYAQYKRHLEDPFYNLTRCHPELFTGGHIIDVGANIGYTAAVFATAIQPGFRVWAFEPSSENVQRLQDSIGRRRLQNVITVRRAAVSDQIGTMDLVLNPDHPGDHRMAPPSVEHRPGEGGVERVSVTTIDEDVRAGGIAPVAFIKIDVQGYELHVCRGMAATLDANPRAAVVVEYAPELLRQYGVQPDALPQFFAQRGYDAYRVTQRGAVEVMRDLPRVLPPPGYIDVLFMRAAQDARS
jgi:FkbM family methyltransferase